MMIERTLSEKLLQMAKKFPVISLTGPRQSGKTTLVKLCFPKYRYASLEYPDIFRLAKEDPRSFLALQGGGLIIDEAQRMRA